MGYGRDENDGHERLGDLRAGRVFGHYRRHNEVLKRPELEQFDGFAIRWAEIPYAPSQRMVDRVQLERHDERKAEIEDALIGF